MNELKDMQDITVTVTDHLGFPLRFVVPWDAFIDEWAEKFKLILIYLQFSVDEIVINPDSDDLQGEERWKS